MGRAERGLQERCLPRVNRGTPPPLHQEQTRDLNSAAGLRAERGGWKIPVDLKFPDLRESSSPFHPISRPSTSPPSSALLTPDSASQRPRQQY